MVVVVCRKINGGNATIGAGNDTYELSTLREVDVMRLNCDGSIKSNEHGHNVGVRQRLVPSQGGLNVEIIHSPNRFDVAN